MTPGPADEVVRCADLASEIERRELGGARLEAIWPADDPTHALVRADGRLIELVAGRQPAGVDVGADVAGDPDGVSVEVAIDPDGVSVDVAGDPDGVSVEVGQRRVLVSRPGDAVAGRAGMQYRDLIPGRLGGRYIASSIRIPDGGPVPDYVHHHDIEFQMIFCATGWVRVVYEDQGPPFVLRPGDCVLQPPGIRHRVLEASPGLEVIEISGPAAHVTYRDHSLALPTATVLPDRDFGGQRFVYHVAATAAAGRWRGSALPARDLGLAVATNGLARGLVVGAAAVDVSVEDVVADAELTFLYVLAGSVRVDIGGPVVHASTGTAVVVPCGERFALTSWTADLSLLDVAVGLSG